MNKADAPTTDPAITEIGATVPADQIDAARAAGANVYVSPRGDGTGLVVDPDAPLPEQVRADIEALPVHGPDSTATSAELIEPHGVQAVAMENAGLVAFRMFPTPLDGTQEWMVLPLGLTFDDRHRRGHRDGTHPRGSHRHGRRGVRTVVGRRQGHRLTRTTGPDGAEVRNLASAVLPWRSL